ncbi:TniQ family protein [Pseudosulfitobacter pseudonitzschiae]|uniref:TniQ family protein n=1 Tax=Pseudosulfitobacter pseudonitzschiae TaxID=1402135 RepID=UPI001AF0D783|nr:TniQ family protein [Pseudosulfitobacter pseudonitzschiae]MBM1816313.1 TniQ family protein [Pseudosulfitobacter pseudonitzschiae]MBM1833826.1 TniQ family protein [Pseudosulfitobacter pseudonitzschiae]MBM1838692.1 TniQ family protein [Pseudosulfitobacter pseudonitzschiae]MBM1843040.1 TniQ family protein [Pseudosulfitobacter pseudonitzschiae]MBM1847906.1 TniQ family protein [Pseudosulfitobacter pseudonitzschiae]
MSALFPILPFADDETPLSWAARQAAFHTCGRALAFLTDLGIPLVDLARGDEAAVLRLCGRAGHDPAAVLRNTISAVGGRRYQLRGLEFAAEFTTGPVTRICPACLDDDLTGARLPGAALRHRLIWKLAPVRTCPVHGTALRDLRLGKWDDIAHELQAMTSLIDNERGVPGRARVVSPLQDYAVARLEGCPGPAWLDGQDIDQAVRATEMLGALEAFGPKLKASDMSEDMWDAAGRAGWPIVSEGGAAIREYLMTRVTASRGKRAAPRAAFGMLHAWLSGSRLSKKPGPIRDMLRDVILETTPLSKGHMLLGKPVTDPHLCSVASIAKAEGLDARTLRNVLKVAGLLSPAEAEQGSNRLVIDYTVARELIDIVKHAVPVTRLPDLLGASRPLVAILIELGKLHRVLDQRALESKVGKAVDGRGVKSILRFLKIKFPTIDETPEGFVNLSKSAEISRSRLKAILELIFLGHLKKVYRVSGAHGFAAVVVDPEEIKALLVSPPPGLSDDSYFLMD